jgi:DNA-binding SARP family transcriptional activator/TolB-like protein
MRQIEPRTRQQRPASTRGADAAPAVTRLRLSLLGRVAAHAGEREIDLANRKCRALLGYLALSDATEEPRERVIGVLWSENEEERARASLRQALYEVRTALEAVGLDLLSASKVALALDRRRLDVDVWSVLAEAKEGRAHPLLLETERLADTLLAEFETIDPAFRVWLLAKRQTMHDRLVRHLELALRDDRADAAKADIARALLNLDPTHEEAVRLTMRLRAEAGDIGGALSVYKRLWDLLGEEYDVEPSKETQELVAALKLAQPVNETRPPAAAPKPSSAAPAIAPQPQTDRSRDEALKASALAGLSLEVFKPRSAPKLIVSVAPFNMAGVRDVNYVVQGFRRELIACLVRFREWAVRDLAAGSSSQAANASTAEYIIEADATGNAQDGLRLALTLLDVATGDFLWSHRIQISVESWFQAQQMVVQHLATALNVHLSVDRLDRIGLREPVDLKAYDLWLLGQSAILSFDPKNWDKAADLFRQVIARMPGFSPAYSSLAQLGNLYHIALPGKLRDPARSAQTLDYAREATRLDPIDSRSQLSLAWSHSMSKQYDQALIHAPLACELNDNDSWTKLSAANCLAFLGERQKAHALVDEAIALPVSPSPVQWSYCSSIRFLEGDYPGCISAAQSAGDANPNVPGYKAAALYHAGEPEAARDEFKRFCEVTRKRWVGDEPATDEAITRWFLTMFPIRQEQDWQRLRDGLAGAGAPVHGLAHGMI